MKRSKKLSDLIFDKPANVKRKGIYLSHIKDYEKIQDIYEDYLLGNYFTAISKIKPYGDFMFFLDLCIYLQHKYKSELYRHSIYQHFVELYFKKLTI
jgi:hypothetical protein